MTTYRLTTGTGRVLDSFEAADPEAAVAHGRRLAEQLPQPLPDPYGGAETAVRLAYTIEREQGGAWHLVGAWVSRPIPPLMA